VTDSEVEVRITHLREVAERAEDPVLARDPAASAAARQNKRRVSSAAYKGIQHCMVLT